MKNIKKITIFISTLIIMIYLNTTNLFANEININNRAIYINKATQQFIVFNNNEIEKVFICSTGTGTNTGNFQTNEYYNNWHNLYYNSYSPGAIRIKDHILIHTVPYNRFGDINSYNYDEHNKLGTPASHGCIRLSTRDFMWVINNTVSGTPVIIINDPNIIYAYTESINLIDNSIIKEGVDPTL